jgi:sugar phosphate isomerase/epimerase
MKLGFITAAMAGLPLETVLERMSKKGIQAVELATRMNSHEPHVNVRALLEDSDKRRELLAMLERYETVISALSCHGNPVHPNKAKAGQDHKAFEEAVLLAEKLGVHRVITFSGCPGDCETAHYPNWVTCAWPDDFLAVLEYQWTDVLIPYWTKAAAFANNYGVDKICLELHPGFCVYNPETLMKLRKNVSKNIGANLDPSHLFWQGIDPVLAVRELGDAIFHVHVKDVKIDEYNTAVNGVLDNKHYSRELERSWIFRTVGYGHDALTWKNFISALRMAGYDYVLSIEHEDSLMSVDEGVDKAIAFLKEIIFKDTTDGIWWA